MDELGHSVTFFNYDLLGPVNQCGVGILHPYGHHRCEDVQSLAHNEPSLHSMGLQQAVEDLGTRHEGMGTRHEGRRDQT